MKNTVQEEFVKLCILIDINEMYNMFEDCSFDYIKFLKRQKEANTIVFAGAFSSPTKNSGPFVKLLTSNQYFVEFGYTRILMVMYAMKYLEEVDGYIIGTCDPIYERLLTELMKTGKKIWLIGNEKPNIQSMHGLITVKGHYEFIKPSQETITSK